jgi:UDPglucose 6-dehydrogenase/GDP-mannose 6-dehydrogenase
MNVSIIGTGYVGLVSGACLAEKGHHVVCVDVDESKIDSINLGRPPIHEKGLTELLTRRVGTNLCATSDLRSAVMQSDISLVAVGTPFDGQEIDLCYVKTAAEQIGTALRDKSGYHVVVVKSTVVPGTTDDVVLPILERASGKRAGVDFGVGMNPEFLKEGEAVDDFMTPDRIVLGGIDQRTLVELEKLYSGFENAEIVRTNPRTAEMIKYSANSLLATLISFSNEVANLCASVGVDVVEVLRGVHLDKRLSPILSNGERLTPALVTYLEAGCGFGGSCFPKDVKALVAFGARVESPMRLLQAVIGVNEAQPAKMLELLRKHYAQLREIRVVVLGVAFKPGTDDIRESPAIAIIRSLLEEGALVRVFDPIARGEAEKVFGGVVEFYDELSEAVDGAHAAMLMTRWEHFHQLPKLLASMSAPPVLIDGRRMLDKNSVPKYEGIGL